MNPIDLSSIDAEILDSTAKGYPPSAAPPPRKLAALIELGVTGGRTGLRTHEAALALAREVSKSGFVSLSGLECYEGLQISGDATQDALTVGTLMQRVKDLALACDRE